MAASGKAFDFKLFRRLLAYTKPYRLTFYFVGFAAIVMSGLSILQPALLRQAIDNSIIPQDGQGLMFYIILMIAVLILDVLFQFAFIFYANWLGQSVIKDIRVK
ncbi:MAG: ABC transporter ATP-binding protein, partial [Flavobacterium sp.]